MLSYFLKHPFVTGIAIVLAVTLALAVRNVNPLLGEMLGMYQIFPFLVIGIIAILWAVVAIGKVFLPKEAKKRKNRARALKARNSKD